MGSIVEKKSLERVFWYSISLSLKKKGLNRKKDQKAKVACVYHSTQVKVAPLAPKYHWRTWWWSRDTGPIYSAHTTHREHWPSQTKGAWKGGLAVSVLSTIIVRPKAIMN